MAEPLAHRGGKLRLRAEGASPRWARARGIRLVLALGVVASLGAMGATPAAGASLSWSRSAGFKLTTQANSGTTVSCSASGFCTAVGTDNFYRQTPFALTTRDPTAKNATWNGGELPAGAPIPSAVSCPSANLCVGVGSKGDALLSTNATSSSPTWTTVKIDGSNVLNGIDCPSESLCVAVDNAGRALVSTTPSGGGGSWVATQIDHQASPRNDLTGVSCTQSATCTAIDSGGDVYVTTAPAAPSPSWSSATVDSPHQLVAVSCPSATLCVAVDNSGHAIASTNPGGGATAWHVSDPDGSHALTGLPCPSETECVAVDSAGNALVSSDAGALTPHWTSTNFDGTTSLDGVSCTSVDVCLAVDANGGWVGTSGALGAPAASTGQANAGTSSATLGGTVNPNSNTVSDCHFEYGTSTAYGTDLPCAPAVGSGPAPVSVSATASGLVPGTTYHFRVVATNSYGTTDGQDVAFVTGGGAAASVSTGAFAWQWKDPTAALLGTVNPHHSPTTVRFFYGPSSEAVSSVGDLSRYPSATDPSWVAPGTTEVPVSATINVQASRTYYYRLVAFNGYGATIGAEHVSSTDAPQPVNTVPPGLQDNGGFDSSQGFRLKCLPGTWTDGNGRFSISWVHVDSSTGTTVPAPGPTSTLDYPGDTYTVGPVDNGWGVGCVVKPYALDGTLRRAPANSELYVVTPPGSTILPPWLKRIFASQDESALLSLTTFYSVGVECVEFADLPGLGEGVCAGAIALAIIKGVGGNIIKNQLDPPDRAYRAVAFPSGQAFGALGRVCARGMRPGACARLTHAARRYVRADAAVVALLRTFYTAANRFLIARQRHDSTTKIVQGAAWKVYSGLMAGALRAQQRAGGAYARELGRARLDVRGASGPGARVAGLSSAQLLRTPLARRLRAYGLSNTEILGALIPTIRHHSARGFDLRRLLTRASFPTTPFVREYDTLGLTDLQALVFAFARQHALPTRYEKPLYRDIEQARAACAAAGRASALRQLLKDAEHALARGFRRLLAAAAMPLIDGHSHIDPYRTC